MNLKDIEKQLEDGICQNCVLSNLNHEDIYQFIDHLKLIMFPGVGLKKVSISYIYNLLNNILNSLKLDNCNSICDEFFKSLPSIRNILLTDVDAFLAGDPALKCREEVILTYLSFKAIFIYRIANKLASLNIPYLPRFLTEYAHSLTGIDINPYATIGHHFFIDHGTGIVIGETCVIGNYVSLYQGVTLGAINLKDAPSLKGVKRHPTICDNVTIYANATILGGNTVIGENCVIGASCFITKSVGPNEQISFKVR